MSEKLAPDGFVFEDGEDFDEPCPICGALHPDSCDEMTHEDAYFAATNGCPRSAVTWYERMVEHYQVHPVVDEGVRLHYQRQLDRLRELEKLLGSDSTGLAIVEVSRLPTPPGP